MLPFKTVAKVNVFLNVLGKQKDDYHQIDSLFIPLNSLYDTIMMQESNVMQINCSHLEVPRDESNLCWQAVELFNKETNQTKLWSINLDKHIPVSGGLGGGSSNAAGVLNYLNQFYNNLVSRNRLLILAKKLGADVAFFLNSKPAIVGGIGEKIDEISFLSSYFIIAVTHFPISARWAYEHLIIDVCKSSLSSQVILQKIIAGNYIKPHNSLAPAILDKFPFIENVLEQMSTLGLHGQVSGSGSSLFALCRDENEANQQVKALTKLGLDGVDFFVASYFDNV